MSSLNRKHGIFALLLTLLGLLVFKLTDGAIILTVEEAPPVVEVEAEVGEPVEAAPEIIELPPSETEDAPASTEVSGV
jgi:hypothetical protein